MLKIRISALLCSTLLVSVLGLTSAPTSVGEPFTYPAPMPARAQASEGPAIAPSRPAQAVPPNEPTTPSTPAQPTPPQQAAPSQPPGQNSGSAGTSRETEQQRSALYHDLNDYVLTTIKGYQGKSYPYLLNNDYANYNGVTTDIRFQGQILLRAHPSGNRASHCVGITFEVFFKAMQARNQAIGLAADGFNEMSFAELQDFMLLWYAAAGPKEVSNPAYAIVKYGLGQEITSWEAAKTGDFVDFSRSNGTGHSVVFLNWIREAGEIVGLRYWSSQESTNGIGYRTEYFSPTGGILPSDFYIGRVGPVAHYK